MHWRNKYDDAPERFRHKYFPSPGSEWYMGISSRPIMDRHAMCMSALDRRSSCFFWYDSRRLRRFLIIKC